MATFRVSANISLGKTKEHSRIWRCTLPDVFMAVADTRHYFRGLVAAFMLQHLNTSFSE